jgi:asparagine synthase (glutamine-hydrolysing)
MLNTLSHRGPDVSRFISLNEDRILLGHTRLSIIDLTENATQPMTNEDSSVWLTFNGEIYNYIELGKELRALGHNFKSNTDSEVIIHAYEEWGKDCVNKLRGIFAFGVFDIKKNSLFLARDHVGVKPLYYLYNNKTLIFSSEIKAILSWTEYNREIDYNGLSYYLAYGNVSGDTSIFKGIKKLSPGHTLFYNSFGNIKIENYWKLTYKPSILCEHEALFLVKEKLEECIKIQTVSDVPLGVLLSGGVDSTIITSLLSKSFQGDLTTFNVGFDSKESDESEYARLVANEYNTKHYHHQINAQIALGMLNDLIEIFDEPFHLNGIFPYYALSKLVNSKGYKVVIGGDGADEVFAGYLWYDRFRDYRKNKPLNKVKSLFGLSRTLNHKDLQQFASYNGFMFNVLQKELNSHYNPYSIYKPLETYWHPEYGEALAGQFLDFNTFLPDHGLTKVDRVSMSQGIEVRVPFLDYELIDLVFSIDHSIVYKFNQRKWLLKNAMEKHLPKGFDQNRKKGFSSPLNKWLKGSINKNGYNLLRDGSLVQRGILKGDGIKVNYHKMGVYNQLLLVGLELWSRRWLENDINYKEQTKMLNWN